MSHIEGNRPICKCHGEVMWRNKSQGGWRCRVKAYASKYPSSRRWQLRQQRERVLRKLDELKLEAEALDP